jgi:23S rRNA (uracil1939-C5)-methyltransferase
MGPFRPGVDTAEIESLTHDARGVAHVHGKATFIDDALPGERVKYKVLNRGKTFDTGQAIEILRASSDRVTPRCPHFGVCGGCSLQHLRSEAQLPAKQKILAGNLARIGKVEPETWLAPLDGPHWGYRCKARLGVRRIPSKGGVIVGFRENRSSFLAPLTTCEVLHPAISRLLPEIRTCIAQLSRPDRIPQVEVAVGDNAATLVFRHLVPLTPADEEVLAAFGQQHDIQIYRQPGAPDALVSLWPSEPKTLHYALPAFNVELKFAPTDFVQVNAELNRLMVSRAIELLDLKSSDNVLDLFCGLGNFTLPIARRTARVVGIEAEETLIAKARANAQRNGIKNAEFRVADLHAEQGPSPWGDDHFDKWLLDPPRTGAIEAIKRLPEQGGPRRIVYVSCNPATLARDSEVLVHVKGYRLQAAGVMDMFPQTSHVEAMALFERAD